MIDPNKIPNPFHVILRKNCPYGWQYGKQQLCYNNCVYIYYMYPYKSSGFLIELKVLLATCVYISVVFVELCPSNI